MKLYVLTRNANYDEYDGHCILAESEVEARKIANSLLTDSVFQDDENWLDVSETRCIEINLSDKGIVLSSFNAG